MSDTVEGMIVKFGADIGDLVSATSQINDRLSSIEDSSNRTASNVSSGFFGAIGSVVSFGAQIGQTIFGLQSLANGAASLAGNLLAPAATAETTQLSFQTLLHSTKAAHDEMVSLNTFAASTPMQTQWVDNAAAKILAFGGTTRDVIPEITAIGDSLSGLGKLSDSSLNSIVDIFGKISAQGKLTGGDMMQLSTWGIPAWQALSDAMGKPIATLQAMVSKGAIPADVAIKALEQGMEKTFGGGMAAQANTFTGLMSTLASNWQIAMAALGSPVLKLVEDQLNSIGSILASSAFQDFATNVGQKIADVFQQIEGVVRGALGIARMFADTWLEAGDNMHLNTIMQAFQSLFGTIQNTGTQLGPLILPFFNNLNNMLSLVATALSGVFAPAIGVAQQIIAGITTNIKTWMLAIEGSLLPAITNLAASIGPVIAAIAQWIQQSNIIPIAFNVLSTVIPVVINGISLLINIISGLIHFFTQTELGVNALKAALILIGTAFTVVATVAIAAFVSMIPEMVAGFITGAAGAWTMAAGVIALTWPILAVIAVIVAVIEVIQHWGEIAHWLQGAWSGIASFFSGVWSNIQSIFSNVGNWFHDRFQQASDGVKSGFGNTSNWFADRGNDISKSWKDTTTKVGEGAIWLYNHNYYVQAFVDESVKFFNQGKVILGQVWATIVSNIADALAWIQNAWQTSVDWLAGLWQGTVSIAATVWDAISKAIQTGFSISINFVSGIWHQISSFFVNAWANYIVSPLTSLWQNVSSFFANAWSNYIANPIASLWDNLSNTIGGWANQAVSWGEGLIQGFINGINNMVGQVGQSAQNVASTVASFLGFHSPAKEGPGSQLMTWGPGLMQGYSDSIKGSLPVLQSTLDLIMRPVASTLSGQSPYSNVVNSGAVQIANATGGNTTGGGVTHVHLYFDSQEVSSILVDPLMEHVVRYIRLQGGKMVTI